MSRTSPFDPNKTWDNYSSMDKSYSERYTGTQNKYTTMQPASQESIINAFVQSDAISVLKESGTPFVRPNIVALQNKHMHDEKTNVNILPYSIHTEGMVDSHYVGSLNVESHFQNGSMTDRLGNVFEVWESQMPPPDKDYRSTANTSSDRRLERLQGYNINEEKKKKEVEGIVHPAEPSKRFQNTQVRNEGLEINSRETFFNKNGLQPAPEREESRNMYDGYNLKASHETRAPTLEHSWRDELSKPVSVRQMANLPDKGTTNGTVSKRNELACPFSIKKANPSNPNALSGKLSKLTLPVVASATLRSKCTNVTHKSAHSHSGDSIIASDTDSNIVKTGRLEQQTAPNKAESITKLPVVVGVLDHQNLMRENDAVKPQPSKEWNVMQQILQGIDHLNEDDCELQEIMNKSTLNLDMPALPESIDHNVDTREFVLPKSDVDHIASGAQLPSKIELNGSDVKAVTHTKRSHVSQFQRSSIPSKIELNGSDVKVVTHAKRSHVSHFQQSSIPSNIRILIDDRASYEVARPAHAAELGQKIQTQQIQQTHRNKAVENIPNIQANTNHTVFPTQREKEQEEDCTYSRTNSMHSNTAEPMRAVHLNGFGSSGTTDTDRIHTPHSQNWRKTESRVDSNNHMQNDRSTPCRMPSRSSSTPVRLIPDVQVESKRETC